jgi:glucose/arabinose dehydrogenase
MSLGRLLGAATNGCRRRPSSLIVGLAGLMSASGSADMTPLEHRMQTLVVEGVSREVSVPAGYVLEVLVSGLGGPRLMTFGANGDLFVGSRSGKVYRIPPPYTSAQVLVELNDYPHGVALRPGEILIAQTGGLYRAPYRSGRSKLPARDIERIAPLPAGGGHSSRSVAVGPDGRIYLSLGISGNCSDEFLSETYPFRDRRGGVLVLREGRGAARWETFAAGLRNPIGFDWHPETGALYASNNGPDHWGYELPPEYFSRLEAGSFHGMPWFQYDGQKLRRDSCIDRPPPVGPEEVVVPVATFPARSAPMGVAFVPEGAMDGRLKGDAVVALHGSWGTQPSGGAFGDPATRRPPKLVVVRVQGSEARGVEDLVTGFQLRDGKRWARPVGVAVGPDGALYFTSDAGAQGLFRLRRATPASNPSATDPR